MTSNTRASAYKTLTFVAGIVSVLSLLTALSANQPGAPRVDALEPPFNFQSELFGITSSLSATVEQVDAATGEVTLNGTDARSPAIPFTFDWGDGSVSDGWFPNQHTYADQTRNHVIEVTANYGGGETDKVRTLARFIPPAITMVPLPPDLAVTVPGEQTTLVSRWPGYGVSPELTYLDDTYFPAVPRTSIEYLLTVAASMQMDSANDDVFLSDDNFVQSVLLHPAFPGMYSIWYTVPVGVGVGTLWTPGGSIPYSSLFHEIGHSFTLNLPAAYHYGGRIDGWANAIYSESMAQIFQHTTAYELMNSTDAYGLPEDLVFELTQSARASMQIVRNAFDQYISSGMPYSSWNDPATPGEDESLLTFMTVAYKFFEHAENAGGGYSAPLKRMMKFLSGFNEDWEKRYDPNRNSTSGSTFRSTLMVAGLSFAFSQDLRVEFRDIGFPVSDAIYDELFPQTVGGIAELPEARADRSVGSASRGTTTVRVGLGAALVGLSSLLVLLVILGSGSPAR